MKHKHLPHIDDLDYFQFITFRTNDSLDDYLDKIAKQNNSNAEKQLQIDEYLDQSNKGSYLNGDVLDYLYYYFNEKDKEIYSLVAFCIMPNHVHMLFKPSKPLSKIMQIIKGSSSNRINKLRQSQSKFWADNYYDKAIRNERHFNVVYNYIKNNPLKLKQSMRNDRRYYGIYE